MFFPKYYRWSDTDRRAGPFIYSRDSINYRPLAMVLSSGKSDPDECGCTLRLSAFGHTMIVALPAIIRPWSRWVDCSQYEWAKSSAKGYWDCHPRDYGFSCSDGFLRVFLGAQTNDSSTTQDWSWSLPWKQWRHVRRSLYDLNGEHHWTEPARLGYSGGAWKIREAAEEACPSRTFAFTDFDGEQLTARTRIEEREWRFGEGWFKWLSLFRAPRVVRSLDIRFSNETGKRKGSWKGGTIGHSIDMLPGELHEAAFRRYCGEHQMAFGAEVPPPAGEQ
jgi:hypothetical protein